MRLVIAGAAAAVAVAALAAYAASGPAEPGLAGEVRVGLLVATSGDFGAYGAENTEAAMLAESEFNRHLEEEGEGWSIRIITEETRSDPGVALEGIMALDAAGVRLVSGPETSASIANVREYAAENGMLLFSCCSVAPSLAIPGDNIFRLIPDDTKQGGALGALLEHEGMEAVIPVWRGDVWGDGLAASVRGDFGGVMDDGIRYEAGFSGFSDLAGDLAGRVQGHADEYGTGNVAVLYMGFGEIAMLAEAASSHGILGDVRWFGTDSNTNDAGLLGDPAAAFAERTGFTTVQASASGESAFYRVRDHVTERLGTEPNSFAHATYDTIWLLGLAMLEARSQEAVHVAAALPGVAAAYEGAIGSTALNDAGDLAGADYSVWGVRDGQWKMLGSFDHRDGTVKLGGSG